jgi:CheY-like chemotaxis protein
MSVPSFSRRILIIDSNEDVADSMAELLGMYGHEVHTAYNATQAVQLLNILQPEVVFITYSLPPFGGCDLARKILTNRSTGSPPQLLIAVTGMCRPEDIEAIMQAGFHHYLLKPVDPTILGPLLA